MDIAALVKITTRAWALDILAAFHEGVPGRQAALLARVGAGRTAFAQSLTHLVDLGLIERNPGHGHPLRPEFRLTEQGRLIAAMASKVQALPLAVPERQMLRKAWSVPVLAVSGRPTYFSESKATLPPITARALSQSLKHLNAQAWVSRVVDPEAYPLRPQYVAIGVGAEVRAAVQEVL